MSKVWVNSSQLAEHKYGITSNKVVWNYAEEPTRENRELGCVTQEPGQKVKWICQDEGGEVNTIQEAKQIVEKRVDG